MNKKIYVDTTGLFDVIPVKNPGANFKIVNLQKLFTPTITISVKNDSSDLKAVKNIDAIINSILDEYLSKFFDGYIYDVKKDFEGINVYVEVFENVSLAVTINFNVVIDDQLILLRNV